jgi:hypothetical protein
MSNTKKFGNNQRPWMDAWKLSVVNGILYTVYEEIFQNIFKGTVSGDLLPSVFF